VFCSNCGSHNDENVKFCISCGTAIASAAEIQNDATSPAEQVSATQVEEPMMQSPYPQQQYTATNPPYGQQPYPNNSAPPPPVIKNRKVPVVWESVIYDKHYTFSYQKKGRVFTVNGFPQTLKTDFWSSLSGFDAGFVLDGIDARLVIEKNVPDVVVNNVFAHSGKKYVKRPAWAIVFAILCIAIPIVSLGGALPALIGFGGAAFCISISKSTLSTAVRVLLCTLLTLGAWLLSIVLIIGFNAL